jgi:hypothetical protein
MKKPAPKSKPKKRPQLSPERRRFIALNFCRLLLGLRVLKWAERIERAARKANKRRKGGRK